MGDSPDGGTDSESGSGTDPAGGTGSDGETGSGGGAGSGTGETGTGTGSGGGAGAGSSSDSGAGSSSDSGGGSGSGSGDGDCPLCNADGGADVGRGSTDTNTSGAPDRSACLPDGSQSFTISNLRPIVGELLQQLAARTATLAFQPAIVAANLAGFVVGIGPAADLGGLHGWGGGAGIYFAPGNVVGYYGTWSEADGLFAGGDAGLSITVIQGMDNFTGTGYAVGASLEVEIGGSFALTFDSSGQTLTGYCASVGFGFSAGLFAQYSHTYITPGS